MPEPKARWRLGVRAMSSRSGSANCAGSRLAAPMPSVTWVRGGERHAAELGGRGRDPVAELVRALDAQELLDRGADEVGLLDQPRLLIGPVEQALQAVADQVGRRLVAGVEQEDAVVQQLGGAAAARRPPRPGSAASARRSRDRRGPRGGARPGLRGSRASRAPRRCRGPRPRGLSTGSSAPRIASDQSRSGSRSAAGTPSRLPMISTGIALAKAVDQVDLAALPAMRSSRPSTSATRRSSIAAMCARRERAARSGGARACAAAGR